MNHEFDRNVIDNINLIDWNKYIGPEYYKTNEVISAITNLVKLNSESESERTYNDILFAVGNNHGGTYYPAIMEALPIILQIAEKSEHEIARNCALEIISDWFFCFDPEIGSYNGISMEELGNFVKGKIKQFAEQHNKIDSYRNIQLIFDLNEYT